jgi:hypothetical protein
MKNKNYVSGVMALATLASLATASIAFAEDNNNEVQPIPPAPFSTHISDRGDIKENVGMMRPAMFGTVTAVSGNAITVSAEKGFSGNTANATFTIDATNAKIFKNNNVGAITDILVGDKIMAQGKVSGTTLTAVMIRDGVQGDKNEINKDKNRQPLGLSGDGQPVILGKVSSVNGSTFVITNKSNANYTIDATNAKIIKGGVNTPTTTDIAVGDNVIVQGAINANAVVASSVIDQTRVMNNNDTQKRDSGDNHKGFFGRIGSFFGHMFGF